MSQPSNAGPQRFSARVKNIPSALRGDGLSSNAREQIEDIVRQPLAVQESALAAARIDSEEAGNLLWPCLIVEFPWLEVSA